MINNEKTLGLYVHIPFCVRKCKYCDFLSVSADDLMMEDYKNALLAEIRIQGKQYSEFLVDSVFIGGGTPSLLPETDIEEILREINGQFHVVNEAEITMECNPGTLTDSKLSVYKEYGVNRLSIGLQSAVDEELKALGRIHTFEGFVNSYEMARKKGFQNINIDLIYGLEGQTKESFEHTLRNVCSFDPEHLSIYSLIVEPGTPFYDKYGENPPMNDETDRAIYYYIREELTKKGYHQYEISNYAKKGFESFHNNKYWMRNDYLGMGLGASSFINEVRFRNTSDFGRYFSEREKGNVGREDVQILTEKEQMEEFMFLGLRRTEGISRNKFQEKFQCPIEKIYQNQLALLEEKKLIERKGDNIVLSNFGIDVSNYVFTELLLV